MKKVVFSLIIFFFSKTLFACDCITSVSINREYNESDVVFIGIVSEVKNDRLIFTISDILKNDLQGTNQYLLIRENGNCSIFPNLGEKWLIYGNKQKGGIFASSCGNSKKINSYQAPPPLPSNVSFSSEEKYLLKEIYELRKLINLQSEMQILSRLNNKRASDIEKTEKESVKEEEFLHLYFSDYVVLILLIVIISLLGIPFFKQLILKNRCL